MKFNEKLKSLREEKGYTQDDVAAKLNIARQSVSKWEQGINEPDFETVKALCRMFECSIAELIDDDRETMLVDDPIAEKKARRVFVASLVFLVVNLIFLFLGPRFTYRIDLGIYIALMVFAVVGFLTAVLMRILTCNIRSLKKIKFELQSIVLAVTIVQTLVSFMLLLSGMLGGMALSLFVPLIVSLVLGALGTMYLFSNPFFSGNKKWFGFLTRYSLSSIPAWREVNSVTSIALATTYYVSFFFVVYGAKYISAKANILDYYLNLFLVVGVIILVGYIGCFIYSNSARKRTKLPEESR